MDYEVYRDYKLKINPVRYLIGALIGIAILVLLLSLRLPGTKIESQVTDNETALLITTRLLTNAQKSLGGDQLNSDLQFKISEYKIIGRPRTNEYIVLLTDNLGNQRCQMLTLVQDSRLEPAEILEIESCV